MTRGEAKAEVSQITITKAIRDYLEEVRRPKNNRIGIGHIPGFPGYTSDPSVVKEAILWHTERLSKETSLIKEIKTRQRIMDLEKGLDELLATAGEGKAEGL